MSTIRELRESDVDGRYAAQRFYTHWLEIEEWGGLQGVARSGVNAGLRIFFETDDPHFNGGLITIGDQ